MCAVSINSYDWDWSESEGKRPKPTPLPHMRLWFSLFIVIFFTDFFEKWRWAGENRKEPQVDMVYT